MCRWKKDEKKAATILTGIPTRPQKAITLNTKEKEACHVWHDEHKAWPRPAVPQRRPVRERPGNKQPLNCLTHTDSSSQPHTRDRRQPAMTFMTQSASWKGKKKKKRLNSDESSEVLFFMISMIRLQQNLLFRCSRCYKSFYHSFYLASSARQRWTKALRINKIIHREDTLSFSAHTKSKLESCLEGRWQRLSDVWKSDELWQDMVKLSDAPAADCFTGRKGPDPLCFWAEVWWKQDVPLITLPYTSVLIDAASC